MKRRDPGAALLLSLAVMVVLSVLAVTFVKLAGFERDASSNHVHYVRAKMAAHSGMQMASGRLDSYFETALVDDINTTEWAYGDAAATPLPWAASPSFKLGSMSIGGSPRGYSGLAFDPVRDADWLPPSYDPTRGIQYALRVTDLNTRIHLNDPHPLLDQLLDILGAGIALYDGEADPVRARGAKIVALRSTLGGRFSQIEDLRGAGLTDKEINVLGGYVTTDAWVDTKVVRPKAQSSGTSQTYSWALDSRSPINVNLAPRAVIYACLRGLAARGWLWTGDHWVWGTRSISDSVARTLTTAIDTARRTKPIVSHYHLSTLLPQSYRSLVMANADPNTRLTKFNPDNSFVNRGSNEPTDMLDKTDLTYWTTEFTFISHGYFQIESLGRIVGRGGQLLSEHHLAQVIKLIEVVRHTTQADFELAKAGTLYSKTYPENMADQRFDATRAATVDGQIALDDIRYDHDPRKASIGWWVDNDEDLLGPEKFRWNNSWIDHPTTYRRNMYESEPVDGLPAPGPRKLLGYTTSTASNLHPDGGYFGENIGALQRYGTVQTTGYGPSASGPPVLHPERGTLDFWFKPDLRGRTVEDATSGVCAWLVLGPNAPIPAAPDSQVELYMSVAVGDWLNGGGGTPRQYAAGSVNFRARKNPTIAYPYSDPYFVLTTPGFKNTLIGQEWNHVRFTWDRYLSWRAYVNGVLAASADGYFLSKSSYGILNWDNIVDVLMVGYRHMPNPWGGAWSNPATGTIDGIRTLADPLYSGVPDRYMLTSGGSAWTGSFSWSGTVSTVRALSMRFSSTPGYSIPGTRKSYVTLEYALGGVTSAAVEGSRTDVPPALAIGSSFDPSSGLSYTVRFHDGGQTPFAQTPYLDDITLFYSLPGGAQVIRQWIVES